MRKYHDSNGNSTPWLSDNPTEKELNRLTIKQLLIIVAHRNNKGLKKVLVDFLTKNKDGN